jgi:hypothetical protein
VVGYCKPPIEYQFKPGQGGRRKGSRNKLGEDFIQALADDFERHGAEVIERVRVEKPEAYIKVVASLLPKDLNLNVSKYDDLTDEQLIVRLPTLTKQAEPLIGRLIGPDQATTSTDEIYPNTRTRISSLREPISMTYKP